MHPILGHLRQLSLYLLAWFPLTAIVFYILMSAGGLSWWQGFATVPLLCLLYAFMCLSAWYSCRGTPLERSGFYRLALTHLVGAALVSGMWVAIAKGWTSTLSNLDAFHGLDQRYAPDYPLLFVMGVMIYLLAVALHYVLLSVEFSREMEKREIQARVLARDSELKALKAQVNPHFLFNSLNSISALTTIDAGRAREMCILLADFLRKTLGLGEKTVIPLSEELELVRSFLSVEKVRFGVRLRVEESVSSGALVCAVPALLLQPLVENAVAHGISNLTEDGWIRLGVTCDASNGSDPSRDGLRIEVENNFDPEMPPRRGHGVGLANVRQRLATRYGERAHFEVRAQGDRFRVSIVLPAERLESKA